MPSLPPQLAITPITRPVSGAVTLPGSKSLTNRALILAALCDAPVTLTGALFSEDTEIMVAALRQLGHTIETDEARHTLRIVPASQAEIRDPKSAISLHVGLAGTAARFLTALCAAMPGGVYCIDGVPQMRKRPMRGLIDALRSLGADIRCTGEPYHFPIEIHARGLRGGPVEIDATESSQMLSALLMVAPLADAPIDIQLSKPVREPFVQMTKNLMAQFGVVSRSTGCQPVGLGSMGCQPMSSSELGRVARATQPYRSPGTYAIEPDATAASYFIALPLVAGGALTLNALRGPDNGGLQGDTRFATVLSRAGVRIRETNTSLETSFPFPPAAASARQGVTENFNEFSDTFLTLAAISPLLSGTTRITGIAHTRKQETDRVAGMARELRKLGQHVIETEDSLEIHPRPLVAGQTIETYHDHRFAMSFGILGCHDLRGDGSAWLTIDNPACCAKTFPNFFELLETIRTGTVSAS